MRTNTKIIIGCLLLAAICYFINRGMESRDGVIVVGIVQWLALGGALAAAILRKKKKDL